MAFNRTSYDVLSLEIPASGMNQNISPEILSKKHAYVLENILPHPIGEGRVRFGTSRVLSLPFEHKIIGLFPYNTVAGEPQQLIYITRFIQDANASSFYVYPDRLNQFKFTTTTPEKYIEDLRVKVTYQTTGSPPITSEFTDYIKNVTIDGNNVIVTLAKNAFSEGGLLDVVATKVYYSIGELYLYDIIGAFQQASFTELSKIDTFSFKFKVSVNFNLDHYAPNQKIQITNIPGITKTYTIAHSSLNGPYLTVETLEELPADFGTVTLFYTIHYKLLKSNLASVCIPRSTFFGGKLLLCNGIDKIMCWNGFALTDIFQYLEERNVTDIARTTDRNLSFTMGTGFKVSRYVALNKIKLIINDVPFISEIFSYSINGTTLTLTVSNDLPAFPVGATISLWYQAFPPAFNFMFAVHGRLWALGTGAAGLKYRDPDVAQLVYYAYSRSTTIEFFDPNSQAVPFLSLSEYNEKGDNLEAIAYIGGFVLFIGREHTQAWAGTIPLNTAESTADFKHVSTIPVGAVHGDLILSIGNDVFIVTKNGLLSCGNFRQGTAQFAATSYEAVNPLILQYVAKITQSNIDYLESRSFKYDNEGLAGFKIGFHSVLASLFTTTLNSWTIFSGNFKEATAFCVTNNALYLSINNILYKYADGKDGSLALYGDDNDKSPVFFSWVLPIMKVEKMAYANYFYDITLSYSSNFTLRKNNQITLQVSGDVPKSYSIDSKYRFEIMGDAFSTVPFSPKAYNQVVEGDLGFYSAQKYQVIKEKFKFVANRFWLIVSGQTRDGVLSFKGVNLYGTLQRKR